MVFECGRNGKSSMNENGKSLLNPDAAIVIPVYNEAEVLLDVLTAVLATFQNVICVDDGCTDNSPSIVNSTKALLVSHPMNLGQGAALQTGIEAALQIPQVKYLVTFDSDGQHSVADALAMVERLRLGDIDVVFGSRFLDERTELGILKKLVLKLAVLYTNALSGVKLTDAHNGLRAFNRQVAEHIELTHNGMAHATEIVNQISRGKFRYAEMPVHIVYTEYSKAKGQSLWNSINILFDLVIR
jgi:glycosyltransferase involved in cell wall biosynthesis